MARTLQGGKGDAPKRQPREGSRFPSQVLGDNVKALRRLRGLSQKDLRERMEHLGFAWSQSTLSELENGKRPTGVDELFALAQALRTTVVKLLDPAAGLIDSVDLGVGPLYVVAVARQFIVDDEDVWALETERTPRILWAEDNEPSGLDSELGKRDTERGEPVNAGLHEQRRDLLVNWDPALGEEEQ